MAGLLKGLRQAASCLAVCAVGYLVLAGLAPAQADPSMIVGPNECAECHKKETSIWQNTHHFSTFRDLPKSEDAEKIAANMGVKRLKAESLCTNCHFTMQTVDGKEKAIAGNSCESCHGPAKEWYKVHSDFSGKKEGQETEAEIAARWEKAEAAGMIRPKMTYALAKNCFSCHLVPNEELVNVGGHTPGSAFELVSWSQGEVRHNTWYNKGKSNPEASIERKRMLFLVGRIVELETALIGVSKATEKKDYAVKMAKRASNATKVMASLAKLLPEAPELSEIQEIASGAKLKLNNQDELTDAAAKISVLGLKFADTYDGTTFAAVDKYIPGADKFKGPVTQ
ncbi:MULTISPECIES: cytochrome c family protein [Roseibium]|uniref:cytochrome c family protein n=1 Tax=Roseibium TaxID=150830 RepID=UPI000A7BC240|nr:MULTISPECIES: cytochrome c family protein [Roseibium]MBO6857348.1 cytochrome c family protein [Roseibium sp.]UFI06001.1 cytochrome c family protein [Roseibium aggregatum]